MKRFQEIENLIFSYITASHGQHSAADLGGAVPLERLATFDWKSWAGIRVPGHPDVRSVHAVLLRALEHLDVTVASVSLYLVPIFGVLLAAVAAWRGLSLLAVCGSGIVLAA